LAGWSIVAEMIPQARDSGERRALRASLAASEASYRAIFETAVEAIIVIDESGVIHSANPAVQGLLGYHTDELLGRNITMLMTEPHRGGHDGYLAAYLTTGQRKVIGRGREVEGLHKDGSIVPLELAVAEWRDGERRFFTGFMHDVSARHTAEAERLAAQRRELVVGELTHRIGNMFAVIQSLVVATARSQDSVNEYRDALLARLRAFACTQMTLAREARTSLGLRELIDFELRPYLEAGRRISVMGEDLLLEGAAPQNFAMIIHELATNAAKYGALSTPGATLSIHWNISADPGCEAVLALEWAERGGPVVEKPQRQGFGSTVIDRIALTLGGTTVFDYAPAGLRFTLHVPAAKLYKRHQAPPT
jgi:PAS domain S-box-containing protein